MVPVDTGDAEGRGRRHRSVRGLGSLFCIRPPSTRAPPAPRIACMQSSIHSLANNRTEVPTRMSLQTNPFFIHTNSFGVVCMVASTWRTVVLVACCC